MSAWLIVAAVVYVIAAAIWFGVTSNEYMYYRTHYGSDERAKWARLVLMTPLWPVGVLDILGAFLGEVSEAARDRVEEEEQR